MRFDRMVAVAVAAAGLLQQLFDHLRRVILRCRHRSCGGLHWITHYLISLLTLPLSKLMIQW